MNENTDRSELDKLLRKRKLSIENADKGTLLLVDHSTGKERTQKAEIECKTLLETKLDTIYSHHQLHNTLRMAYPRHH